MIAVIGIIVGNAIGIGINYYLIQSPIEFSGPMAELYADYGFLPLIKSSLDPTIFFNNSILILLISLVACIYPALKVYMLEPLKGIRYT
jgi:ABC-type lipoprotein release transport system permease subunit